MTNAGVPVAAFAEQTVKFYNASTETETLRITSDGKLLVAGADSYHGDADDLVLKERSGSNVGMTFQNTGTGYGVIYFADSGSQNSGRIQYDHSSDSLDLFTAGSERLSISSDGTLYINGDGTGGRVYAASGKLYLQSGNGRQSFNIADMAAGQSATHEFNSSGNLVLAGDITSTNGTFSGKVEVGSSYAGGEILTIGKSSGTSYMSFHNGGTATGFIGYADQLVSGGASDDFALRATNDLVFATNGNSEVLRLTDGGLMGLGTNSPSSYIGGGENLVIAGSGNAGMTIATGTSSTGSINFADGTSGNARYRGRFEYSHSLDALDIITAATTQIRVDSIGRLLVNTTSPSNGASYGNIVLEFGGNSYNGIKTRDTDNTGTVTHLVFVSGSAAVGSITGDTGQAYYNNLSDYRRKENDVEIADGIQKLKLLRPIRFNYISDPNTVCDGFFAHEVTPAVPTAVTGEKDAVDSEGEIDPQMLDASKIVPLLTAALQEAIAKIETLETKVAALENP